MKKITPISDDDLKLQVETDKGVGVFYATDMIILWDECHRGVNQTLAERYEVFRMAMESLFGGTVSRGTAYLVLEEAVGLLKELKKTHLVLLNSKPTESVQLVEVPTNSPSSTPSSPE